MNPVIALLVVVALIFVTPLLAKRMKGMMPQFLRQKSSTERSISVLDVVPLDSKRKLVSVSMKTPGGRRAMAVLLTGGASDICVSCLEDEDHSLPAHDNSHDNSHDMAISSKENSTHV